MNESIPKNDIVNAIILTGSLPFIFDEKISQNIKTKAQQQNI